MIKCALAFDSDTCLVLKFITLCLNRETKQMGFLTNKYADTCNVKRQFVAWKTGCATAVVVIEYFNALGCLLSQGQVQVGRYLLIDDVRGITVCGYTWNMPFPPCVQHYISSAPRPLKKKHEEASMELAVNHIRGNLTNLWSVRGQIETLVIVLYFVFYVI